MVMDWHARQGELVCCYLQEMNGTLPIYKFMNIYEIIEIFCFKFGQQCNQHKWLSDTLILEHIKEYIDGTIERLRFIPDLYYLHRINASKKGCGITQIALAWVATQGFAIPGTTKPEISGWIKEEEPEIKETTDSAKKVCEMVMWYSKTWTEKVKMFQPSISPVYPSSF
jgi:hypothetical protein